LAKIIAEIFTEVIIARASATRRWPFFPRKKTCGFMIAKEASCGRAAGSQIVVGGVLVQDRDRTLGNVKEFKVVTKREPTRRSGRPCSSLEGGKHVKSNSIVYCRGEQTLGIGAGQMARVDSSRIAVWKAGEAKLDLKGSVVASEALFRLRTGWSPRRKQEPRRPSSGRLGARRGSHPCRRRARHGDGLHCQPAFQTLSDRLAAQVERGLWTRFRGAMP